MKLPLTTYFFFLTGIVAILIFPYAYKCKKDQLTISFRPQAYWKEFKVVLTFSLAIFALSLFQATATQSRPIILSMFSKDGASSVADFRIVEVIPSFIIMLSGTFSGIFLPKTSEMVARHDQLAIENFAYKWTRLTTIVVCSLSFPFFIGGRDALSAYVGSQNANLYIWLVIWIATVIIQMHTTPGFALILAYGKTKILVIFTAISCIISIILNCYLSRFLGVGSAIIAYGVYVLLQIGLNYVFFYKKLLKLRRMKLFWDFLAPTLVGIVVLGLCFLIPFNKLSFWNHNRMYYVLMFFIKALAWFIPYVILIFSLKLISFKEIKSAK